MKHYQSTLANITSEVWATKTADEAKSSIINYLNTTRVKDKDRMIADVNALKLLDKVWRYFANSLLKFEGLSTTSYIKGTQPEKQTEEVLAI